MAALLQGFPRDFEFIAPWEKPRLARLGKLIGNAVPPPFGKHVGTLMMSCVINDEAAEH